MSTTPTRAPESSSTIQPLLRDSPPTSITAITQSIAGKMHELTALGRHTIHCQWIRPQANTGASRFFSVTLADTTTNAVAIPGFIWDQATITKILADGERQGMNLAARDACCEVILDATIDCWAKQAKPYLRVLKLNTIGMRGLKHQQRDAAIARLRAEGDFTRNRQRPWTHPTLRLALLTKPGSAAYEDALSILRQSPFAISVTLFPVAVQGIQAESTIVRAFDEVTARHRDFDAVLLIRGGGGELDLAAYDLYRVARAVAHCPIPVLTGLGHQIDQSVCDLVAYQSLETPTAAAHYLVTHLNHFHTQVLTTHRTIQTQITQHTASVSTEIQTVTQGLIQHAFSTIHATHRALLTTSSRILLEQGPTQIHQAHRHIQTLTHAVHAVITHDILGTARRTLRRMPRDIHSSIQIVLGHRQQRVTEYSSQIEALNPHRLIALGYALVTGLDNHIIHAPNTLAPKHRIRIHFLHHIVTATITSIKACPPSGDSIQDMTREDPSTHDRPPTPHNSLMPASASNLVTPDNRSPAI